MNLFRQKHLLFFLSTVLIISACNAPNVPPTAIPSVEEPQAPANPVATVTNVPEPTPTQAIDTSLHIPEIASITTETIYDQRQRANHGGKDTFFWPDGNIGYIPIGNGQFRFFAANSIRSAVTVGSLDDPGAMVENNRLTIQGVDPQYTYASGGPVYSDPESGLILMFYHAERHFGGNGSIFHAAIGLARSRDDGQTFQNLGIILENNAPPDVNAPCCADMGGATYTIKDGQFLVFFRDRQEDLRTTELTVATAPVEEVVEGAKKGTVTPWFKYYINGQEPGISGQSSPLETGNPFTAWFSVSDNIFIERFIMVIATHSRTTPNQYQLYLIASEDGYEWSPRVLLLETDDELTYPTIISPDGDLFNTSETLYIYYVTTPPGVTRWHNTPLHRMTVTLSGKLLEPPHEWDFEINAEGWKPLFDMESFEVQNGALAIQATGADPYMESPTLGISAETFKHIEVRMKVGKNGAGQFFFTTREVPYYFEEASVSFPVEFSEEYVTYTVDMTNSAAWKGPIGNLRFDPIDQETTIEVDYIRFIP